MNIEIGVPSVWPSNVPEIIRTVFDNLHGVAILDWLGRQ